MDELFELLNPYGRYQKQILILIGLSSMLTAMTIYSTIFTTASPQLNCFSHYNSTQIDPCDFIDSKFEEFIHNTTEYGCTLDDTHYGNTIITKFSLYCNKKLYARLTQTIYMIGALTSIIIGCFSDLIGRRKTIISINIFLTFFLTLNQILHLTHFNFRIQTLFFVYSTTQFISGFLSNGLYMVTYILLTELTIPKYKTTFTNINNYFYVLGELVVLLVSYYARDWEIINWFVCAYSVIVLILLILFLPESPRFLFHTLQFEQAHKIVEKISIVNKVKDFDSLDQTEQMIRKVEDKRLKSNPFVLILKDKLMILKCFLVGFVWFSVSLVYFGIGLGVTNFNFISPYLMYFLSSISELLGCFLAYLSDYFRRKNTFIGFLLIGSLTCCLVAFIPNEETDNKLTFTRCLIIFLTILGKGLSCAASICAYVYTASMMPTKIRGTMFLFVASIGRIGSIIAPLIDHLGQSVWKPLTFIIFAICSFLGSVIIKFLQDPDKFNHL